uniref:Glycoside hydrolase family 3 N-terminal domain-containing protein n=1 Tax=Aegilops tauschii subsp. strangulata TaxID=200361 RepID=A0A453GLL8_AEGTS
MGRRTRTHAVQAAALLLAFLHLHVAAAADPPFSCGAASGAPYCDRKLPMERRAADLVSKLSLEEKISQLGDESPAVARLGVPAYKWWSEALHGVAWSKGMHLDGPLRAATSFPQVILTAASFNPHLWYRIGQAIGREARGVYNNGQAEGLTLWAPNINVFRDPRWGRGQETPGEDPAMTGKYAAVFVRGVQGYGMSGATNSSDLEASACCKHFTAYDLDNWKGVTRFAFDAKVVIFGGRNRRPCMRMRCQKLSCWAGDGAGPGGHVQPAVQELRGGRRRQRHHVLLQPRQWRAHLRRPQPPLQDRQRRLELQRIHHVGLRRRGHHPRRPGVCQGARGCGGRCPQGRYGRELRRLHPDARRVGVPAG